MLLNEVGIIEREAPFLIELHSCTVLFQFTICGLIFKQSYSMIVVVIVVDDDVVVVFVAFQCCFS